MSVEYNVLLIEDNPGDARLLEITLNQVASTYPNDIHFNVRWVNLLKTGIGFVEQHQVHIVFLDLSLPDSDGLKSIDSIIAVARKVPVIVVSGMMDASLYDDVLDHGAQGYVLKDDLNAENLYLILKSTLKGF